MNVNIRTARFAPVAWGGGVRVAAAMLAVCALALSGCDNSGGHKSNRTPDDREPNLLVTVVNAVSEPIAGATVTINVNGTQRQAATGQDGKVTFATVPQGPISATITADGYESATYSDHVAKVDLSWHVGLDANGAWAVGRPIILGTELLERAANGSSVTVAVDVAVIAGEQAQPVLTMTAADFRPFAIECGWGGPRDCASDANGNASVGDGGFATDGIAREFELLPASARRPYVAGLLVERSGDGSEWAVKGPAMKAFFTGKNITDAVGLASVQHDGNATTMTVLGPFTNDGSIYNNAIDQLGLPSGNVEEMFAELLDAIRWTGAAAATEFAGHDATLLVLAAAYLSVPQIDEAVALARDSGVRISGIPGNGWGISEVAARTGGFTMQLNRLRQNEQAFAMMDSMLSGSIPFYRMQFNLTALPGTFVEGGNVRVHMQVYIPKAVVSGDVFTSFDVAIPDAG